LAPHVAGAIALGVIEPPRIDAPVAAVAGLPLRKSEPLPDVVLAVAPVVAGE
jgi:hypothetical protein